MRILHVVQPPRGGAPALVELLVREQLPRHEVGVVCRPGLASRIDVEPARVWALPMRREVSPLEDFQNLIRLIRIVGRFRPDVLHLHSSKAGALGRVAARLTGVPTVFSPHNFAHSIHEGSPRVRRLFLLIERALAPSTDQLHLTYEDELEEALRLGLARLGSVAVVPNGIDVGPLLSVSTSIREPPTIGTYARLWPQKRIDILLRALSMLAKKGLSFRVAIIGNGPLRSQLERLSIDLGIAKRTRFLDDRTGRVEAMQELDVYVLSSSHEAFPLVPMEAMAAGRPVVATAVGAVPEIVRDNQTGFLVPADDVDAMGAAIEQLIVDASLRERLGDAGRDVARTRFGIQTMSGRLEALYRAAIQ